MKTGTKFTPIYFLSSTMFSHILQLIAGVISYRYIAPDYMGIWTTITSFTVFAIFLRLGIANGMSRELPYYLGRNEREKANSCAETTLFYSILITIVLIIVCAFFYLFYDSKQHNEFVQYFNYVFFAIALKIIVEPYNTYLSSTFRTNNSFNNLSTIQIIMATSRLLSVVLIIFWNFKGYILRDLLLTVLNLALLQYWRPLPNIKPKFNIDIFKSLFSVGFRIFIAGYVITFIDTLPKLMIINKGTILDMGIMSPIFLMISILILIPNTLTSYLYPKFSQALGRGEEFLFFWSKMKIIYILSFVISLFGAIFIYFGIDYLITFFPKYIDSVPYIKLSCISLLFLGYKLGSALFIIFKKWSYLWTYTILNSVIMILSLIICTYYYADILNAIIVSLIITYSLMFIIAIAMTYRLKCSLNKIKI